MKKTSKVLFLLLLAACLAMITIPFTVAIINTYKTNQKNYNEVQDIIIIEVSAAAKAAGLSADEIHNVHSAVKAFLKDSDLDKFHAKNTAAAAAPIKAYAYAAANAYARTKAIGKTDDAAYSNAYAAAKAARKDITDKIVYDIAYDVAKSGGESDAKAHAWAKAVSDPTTKDKDRTDALLKASSDIYHNAYADAKTAGMSEADASIVANAAYYADIAFPIVIALNITEYTLNAAKIAGKNADEAWVNAKAAGEAAKAAFVKTYTPIYLKAYADAKAAGKNNEEALAIAKAAGETFAKAYNIP
jgi:hypothetical protein